MAYSQILALLDMEEQPVQAVLIFGFIIAEKLYHRLNINAMEKIP